MSSPQWKSFEPPVQDSSPLALEEPPSTFSNSSSNSNNSKVTMRETGIIEKLLHSYGFIQCCDRQARLFFHYSQFNGNVVDLKVGDDVEFEVNHDRKTGKPIASSVVKISPSVISYEVLNEEQVTGIVTTEIASANVPPVNDETDNCLLSQGRISYECRGECFFLPYTMEDIDCSDQLKSGDKVVFQIATDKRTGTLRARHIQTEAGAEGKLSYMGVICSLKETFGFIERADVVKEIFFHASEAQNFTELDLGEDVEFQIQTRNGKEVAVKVVPIPEGSVIFEDVSIEKLKGQVIKVADRNSTRHQTDPLPGIIQYERNEKMQEISFSEKDQLGSYTLLVNDWVTFNFAIDRRDSMQRATNIELLEESFLVSGETREQGTIVAVKEGFGFIKCQDRDARMFFHFSELLQPTWEVRLQDEVDFSVIQDAATNGRQNAIRIKYLPAGTVKFKHVIKNTLTGIVEKEPGNQFKRNRDENNSKGKSTTDAGLIVYGDENESSISFYLTDCDPRSMPNLGDKVQFNVSNSAKTAIDVKVLSRSPIDGLTYTSRGFVAALKDGFGFIETEEHDKEVFFHFSVFNGSASQLELGAAVEYSIAQKNTKVSAECVRRLENGFIESNEVSAEILEGVIIRPIRCFNPDQDEYSGLVQVGAEGSDGATESYEFGITSLHDKKEFLQTGDTVQFQVGIVKSTAQQRAFNIKSMRKKMQAVVEAIKGQFGFLSYEIEEGKKLFFHMTEVADCATLQTGDKVEFVIIHNKRTGRSAACNVTKMSGSDPRPEHMISRFRLNSVTDDIRPRLIVLRQPKGPDGSDGFKISKETAGDMSITETTG